MWSLSDIYKCTLDGRCFDLTEHWAEKLLPNILLVSVAMLWNRRMEVDADVQRGAWWELKSHVNHLRILPLLEGERWIGNADGWRCIPLPPQINVSFRHGLHYQLHCEPVTMSPKEVLLRWEGGLEMHPCGIELETALKPLEKC